jgi:hypothetical protein
MRGINNPTIWSPEVYSFRILAGKRRDGIAAGTIPLRAK